MGMGNTVDIRSQVCSGTGMGSGLLYPYNTILFSTVLWVCQVPGFWSCDSIDMLIVGLLLSTMTYVAHLTPLPCLKSETEVSAVLSGADDKAQMTESLFGPW